MGIGRPKRLRPSRTRQQITGEVQSKRRWAYLFDDLVTPIATALLWLLLPFEVSTTGRITGALIIASVAPIDVIARRYGRPDRRSIQTVATRVAVAIAISAAVPIMWHPANVLITGVIVASIPVEPKTRLIPLGSVAVVAMTIVGIVRDVEYWYLTAPMLVLVFLGAEFSYQEWRRQRVEADRRFDELIDRARMFAWEIDRDTGNIVNLTGNVDAVLGYPREELIGRHWTEIIDPQGVERVPLDDRSELESHSTVRAAHRDGHTVTLREMIVSNHSTNLVRGVSTDVSELAEATEALRHQAEHDSLTGLYNRAVLERELEAALGTLEDDEVLALLVVDLDRFKEVNDTLGHPAGDRLLRILAKRFLIAAEELELVARIGGDEFAFVYRGRCSRHDIVELGNRIHEVTMGQVEFDGIKLAVSCSIGVAYAPDHGTDIEQLMSRADMAAYVAKRAGGGVRVFESAPEVMSVRRLQLTAEIPSGLERGEFRLYMQPLVDLQTGRIVGAEGLARWHHPEHALLTPDDFIGILEVSADYHRFTNDMMAQAASFAQSCAEAGAPIRVAVNLGSMSFRDHGLPYYLATLLDRHDLPGDALTLEVTEGDLLDEGGDAAPVFDALSDLGVRLSIDDFGTGYSSLQRLRALDVDEVKIDRSFVSGVCDTPADAIIVHTVIQLACLLDHEVVAEGIETDEQYRALLRFGCTTGQGYLFARPMPADELLELITDSPYLRLPELVPGQDDSAWPRPKSDSPADHEPDPESEMASESGRRRDDPTELANQTGRTQPVGSDYSPVPGAQ